MSSSSPLSPSYLNTAGKKKKIRNRSMRSAGQRRLLNPADAGKQKEKCEYNTRSKMKCGPATGLF